jgi:hypothetical protein
LTHAREIRNNRTGQRFVFTKFIADVTEDNMQIIKNDPDELQRLSIQCGVWQVEKAPDTGRIHLQGYIEFEQPCRFFLLHQLMGGGTSAWINTARGNRAQCRAYCSKPETRLAHPLSGPYEVGDWASGGQGTRNDVDELKRVVQARTPEIDLVNNQFGLWHRHWRVIEKAKKVMFDQSNPKGYRTKLRILIGPPGLGNMVFGCGFHYNVRLIHVSFHRKNRLVSILLPEFVFQGQV